MLATVNEILKSKSMAVKTVATTDSVASAVKQMVEFNIGALPVVENERLMGIFSERDVLTRIVDGRLDPDGTKVAQVMTHDPVSAEPKMRVLEALQMMSTKRFRHLPVVDGGRLIGMVSMGDLTARVIGDQGDNIDAMIRTVSLMRPSG